MLYSCTVKRRYPLDESLKSLFLIHTPLSRLLFPLSSAFLSQFTLHSDSDVTVTKVNIGKCQSLLVTPKDGEKYPVLIYLHGGAFVYKAAPYHYRNVREYAVRGRCRVLMPDYRLSPKWKYPAAVEDAFEAYKWAQGNLSPSSIAVGGDSAGGEIALSLTERIIEEGIARPRFLMLVYPVVTLRSTETKELYKDTPVWNSVLNERMWKLYLGDGEYRDVLDSPDLPQFPPCYIETAEFDALRGDGEMLRAALEKSSVGVTYRCVTGACHGYDMVSSSPITKASMELRIRYILDGFNQNKKLL